MGKNARTGKIQHSQDRLKKRLMTVKEAAVYLGRTHWGIRELIWAGKLPFVKTGRVYYLDTIDLNDFINKYKSRFEY